MKTSKIYSSILFILFILVSFQSCFFFPKDPPRTTPPTGENTLYFYTDGILYYAKTERHIMGPIRDMQMKHCYLQRDSTVYNVLASNVFTDANINSSDKSMLIELFLPNGFTHQGIYVTDTAWYDICLLDRPAIQVDRKNGMDGTYFDYMFYSHPGSGEIRITYVSADSTIVKGTFEGVLYREDDPSKSFEIRDGHFHVNLETVNDLRE